jgi:serine/threonine-protein kinase HipA
MITPSGKNASREHAESAGIFDLLAVIGRDYTGALRFVPEGADPGDTTRMEYRPVSDDEIATRLVAVGTNPPRMHADEDDFRITIAGVQAKTAFLRIDTRSDKAGWRLPLGPTPTSHIFKPAMKEGQNGAGFSDTPCNEWLCLVLCRVLDLETANAGDAQSIPRGLGPVPDRLPYGNSACRSVRPVLFVCETAAIQYHMP